MHTFILETEFTEGIKLILQWINQSSKLFSEDSNKNNTTSKLLKKNF